MQSRVLWLAALAALPIVGVSQRNRNVAPAAPAPSADVRAAYPKQAWRNIGPWRGGRSIAVAGHVSQPGTYYFGATGGGVWKTTNGGHDWACVSDSFLRTSSSVGAIAVASSDANTVWAGMGERDIRGNFMQGDGVYRSLDGGKSWAHMGLEKTGIVSRIVIHPQDPSTVYVAALGRIFGQPGANAERGIFRTRDGGKSWQRVLFVDDTTGAAHLAMDPSNPRVLYAAMWNAWRSPWAMSSGGKTSGLYRSTDGGDTWTNISNKPGLPKGILGKIGVSISPVDPNRVWALVENENGGLFRSDDAGETWTRVNEGRNLRQRAWYYTHVHADPQNKDRVYVLNVNFMRSDDAGKTFVSIPVGHGDTHDLWIDPNDNNRMILGDDGGAEVTTDGGQNWTDLEIPTAQLYHVALDNGFPYRVAGSQQDNSTISVPHRTTGWTIGTNTYKIVGGGESGYVAPHPKEPGVVLSGNYDGYLLWRDADKGIDRNISVWPESNIGGAPAGLKYRWQWTYPIVFSPHNPDVIYVCSQHVHRSTDGGRSWREISPDLTRNDKTKQQSSGGPITKDNTGVEVHGTVFALAESPVQKDLLWAGTDDGLVHLSRDGGATWKNVTPPGMPEWGTVSIVEASPFQAGTAYIAVQRYRLGDEQPYLFRTTDFGATWTRINAGIPTGAFTHVIRTDPNAPNLLYAGTERGVYVSLNDGASWQPLQLNLPVSPVRDLAVHKQEKDLVAATHGRSFWVLDDLTPLHQLAREAALAAKPVHLFQPRHVYRVEGAGFETNGRIGQNPPNGVLVNYHLSTVPGPKDTLFLTFLDARDSVIARFNHRQDLKGKPVEESKQFYEKKDVQRNGVPSGLPGANRFVWNLRYPDLTEVPGAIYWGASLAGPKVAPGTYTVELRLGAERQRQTFEVRPDPVQPYSAADYAAQADLLQRIYRKAEALNKAINRLRDTRKALDAALANVPAGASKDSVSKESKALRDQLAAIEEQVISSKLQAGQDILNYGIRLNNKLMSLAETVFEHEGRPTAQAEAVYQDLAGRVDAQLKVLTETLDREVPRLNALIKALDVPALPSGSK